MRALVRGYPTAEVAGLLRALMEGRVDGSTYTGACACLVGTIANLRDCDTYDLPYDPARPAERWALAILPGHTPQTSQVCALTAEWIQAELATRSEVSQ